MIYAKLSEIKTAIEGLSIYNDVQLGTFHLNLQRAPVCFIKSGSGNVELSAANVSVHIIGFHKNVTNVEQELQTQMYAVHRKMLQLADVQLDYFTTDEDTLEPYGISIPVVPPHGIYRLTYSIHEIV